MIKSVLIYTKLPQEHRDILYLSESATGEEYDASKPEVPAPNFITEGVPPRRDGVYLLVSPVLRLCICNRGRAHPRLGSIDKEDEMDGE